MHAQSLAAALSDHHQVDIFCLNTENLPEISQEGSVTVHHLPCFPAAGGRLPLPKASALQKFQKYIEDNPADAVIMETRLYPFNLWASGLLHKKKIPFLIIDHGTGHIDFGNHLINHLWEFYEHCTARQYQANCRNFYGVSEASIKWLSHFGIQGKGVISNGVLEKDFSNLNPAERKWQHQHGIPDSAVRITYSGRLLPAKGIVILLQALDKIGWDQIHLVIAGDGDMNLINQWISNPHIHFLGRVHHDEMAQIFSETQIFCLPTDYPEGMPTVILEAGYCGNAVISTNKGGIPEVIHDGETGLITRIRDIDDLKEKIQFLISHPEEQIRLGKNLKQLIEKEYLWSITTKKVEKIFTEMRSDDL